MRAVGPILGVLSILCGLFGLLAPVLAWAGQAFGFFSTVSDDSSVEAVGELAIVGSMALAFAVVASSPAGLVLGVLGAGISRAYEQSVIPSVLGLLLNVLAPVTWLLTWAGFIALLLWLFQGFHW